MIEKLVSAHGTQMEPSPPLTVSLSRAYAHELKVTYHMEKTCEKYQVLQERAPRESNFSVWYKIE